MNGDLLWHTPLWRSAHEDAMDAGKTGTDAYDFSGALSEIADVISQADMAICQEEVPLAADGGPYSSYPSFNVPPEVAAGVAATGYDLCTTASNHTVDKGNAGLVRTLDALQGAGLLTTGSYRNEAESNTPTIFSTADGVKIAVVAGTYGTNGIPVATDKSWSIDRTNADDMIARAEQAKAAGADIVIAALHSGQEYQVKPTSDQVALATRLTASSAVDLVYGHHVHVVQPWTKINGKWVAYGLGNTIAQQPTDMPRTYEGVTARFTFTEKADGTFEVTLAEYIPTLITRYTAGSPARVLPVKKWIESDRGNQARLVTARQEIRKAVTSLGETSMVEA